MFLRSLKQAIFNIFETMIDILQKVIIIYIILSGKKTMYFWVYCLPLASKATGSKIVDEQGIAYFKCKLFPLFFAISYL